MRTEDERLDTVSASFEEITAFMGVTAADEKVRVCRVVFLLTSEMLKAENGKDA